MSKLLISAAVCIGISTSVTSAENFDWSSNLGQSTSSVFDRLSSFGKCELLIHSVNTDTIQLTTTIQKNLRFPLSRSGILYEENTVPPNVSFEKNRIYGVPEIPRIFCKIGSEGRVNAYAFNDQIFHIELFYTRCAEYASYGSLCVKDLFESQPYDTGLYEKLKHQETRIRNKTNSDLDKLESLLLDDLYCGPRPRIQDNYKWRCIISYDNSSQSKWTGISMWEQYESGIFKDSVIKHLASKRYFVDLVTEQKAIEAMNIGLQNYINNIQSEIRIKLKATEEQTDKLNSVLGGD